MDAKISVGDIYLSASGTTAYLCGAQEAAQRVRIAASVAKGTFIYNRALGTDYAALDAGQRLADSLDLLIREACAGVADTDVSVTEADEESAVLQIMHGGETITTEVELYGNV